MGELAFETLQTPNARFVYKEAIGLSAELDKAIFHLKQLIESSPRLERANPDIFQYFFASPEDEDFEWQDSWPGIEVVGMLQLTEEAIDEGMNFTDLDSAQVYSFALKNFPTVVQLRHAYNQATKTLLQQGKSFAKTWRLRLGERPGPVAIEFFAEEDCGDEG